MTTRRPGDLPAAGHDAPAAAERAWWRAVALPSEHGGWGLTLEPVLLGVLIAPSWAGAALGVSAFLAFLVRTPLKLAAVDMLRHRWLRRSQQALAVATVELLLMAVLVALAVWSAGWRWAVPVAVAAPLVAVELWYDVRSRGRRLVPELCGAVGIASVAAVMVLAASSHRGDGRLAVAAWLVLAARSLGAIPFVRAQIVRLRRGSGPVRGSDLAQVLAIAVGVAAVVVDHQLLLGAVGVTIVAGLHVWWVRCPPRPPKVLGIRQTILGLALVLLSASGVRVF